MGLYDHVHIAGPDLRFVCSEGHDVTGEEFQSKDWGCTMGDVHIAGDAIGHESGGYGDDVKRPYLGRFYVYCTCTQCPAFVQNWQRPDGSRCHNVIDMSVTFELEVVDDKIRNVKRVSTSTADWLRDEPTKEYMRDAIGPMPRAQAVLLRREMWK